MKTSTSKEILEDEARHMFPLFFCQFEFQCLLKIWILVPGLCNPIIPRMLGYFMKQATMVSVSNLPTHMWTSGNIAYMTIGWLFPNISLLLALTLGLATANNLLTESLARQDIYLSHSNTIVYDPPVQYIPEPPKDNFISGGFFTNSSPS